jgi:hypothetical protein
MTKLRVDRTYPEKKFQQNSCRITPLRLGIKFRPRLFDPPYLRDPRAFGSSLPDLRRGRCAQRTGAVAMLQLYRYSGKPASKIESRNPRTGSCHHGNFFFFWPKVQWAHGQVQCDLQRFSICATASNRRRKNFSPPPLQPRPSKSDSGVDATTELLYTWRIRSRCHNALEIVAIGPEMAKLSTKNCF